MMVRHARAIKRDGRAGFYGTYADVFSFRTLQSCDILRNTNSYIGISPCVMRLIIERSAGFRLVRCYRNAKVCCGDTESGNSELKNCAQSGMENQP